MFKVNNVNVRSITDIPVHCTVIPKSSPQPTVVYRVYFVVFSTISSFSLLGSLMTRLGLPYSVKV